VLRDAVVLHVENTGIRDMLAMPGNIMMWWSLLTILGVLLALALATSGDA
jgi:hypothetical protein